MLELKGESRLVHRTFSGIMLALLLLIMPALKFDLQPAITGPVEIIVPEDYPTIQEAINAARPGDTIFVRTGTYYEHVIVNKSISLIGEDRGRTIIDAEQDGVTVIVIANQVSIMNFTIRNSGTPAFISYAYPCILLYSVQDCDISFNYIVAKGIGLEGDGIVLEYSFNNDIHANTVSENGIGILIENSFNNGIRGNNVTRNGRGIIVSYSRNNLLRDNHMVLNDYNFGVFGDSVQTFIHNIDTSNTINGKPVYYFVNQYNLTITTATHPSAGYLALVNSTGIIVEDLELKDNIQGMVLAYTANSQIRSNNVTHNRYGIYLFRSSNNIIQRNSIRNNVKGIWLYNSSDNNNIIANNIGGSLYGIELLGRSSANTVSGNNIQVNGYGITLIWSFNNGIYRNNITRNDSGIDLYESSNNRFWHNNFVDNVIQASVKDSINVWDDGYPSGGNYWSDHNPPDMYSGLYQNETGSDGVGDIPYIVDGNNIDRYPLIYPYGYVPGPDLNGDGKVGIRDIAIAAMAFGSHPGHPRWNETADVNRDAKVDIRDIALIARDFGKISS